MPSSCFSSPALFRDLNSLFCEREGRELWLSCHVAIPVLACNKETRKRGQHHQFVPYDSAWQRSLLLYGLRVTYSSNVFDLLVQSFQDLLLQGLDVCSPCEEQSINLSTPLQKDSQAQILCFASYINLAEYLFCNAAVSSRCSFASSPFNGLEIQRLNTLSQRWRALSLVVMPIIPPGLSLSYCFVPWCDQSICPRASFLSCEPHISHQENLINFSMLFA